jgi:hypothetical protein
MEAGIAVLDIMRTRVFLSREGKLLRCGDRQLSECAIALRLQELRWLEQEDDYRLPESVFGEQKGTRENRRRPLFASALCAL